MNGIQYTIPGKDVPQPSSPNVGWDEFSRELVELIALIKPARCLGKRMGLSETFITDQQGVISRAPSVRRSLGRVTGRDSIAC